MSEEITYDIYRSVWTRHELASYVKEMKTRANGYNSDDQVEALLSTFGINTILGLQKKGWDYEGRIREKLVSEGWIPSKQAEIMQQHIDYLSQQAKPSKPEKPPLGLRPKSEWKFARLREIQESMERYARAGKQIPVEWTWHMKEVIEL